MVKQHKDLRELFHNTLKDIYFAEKKILSTLPKMAKAAQNEELKAAFEKHRGETEGQEQEGGQQGGPVQAAGAVGSGPRNASMGPRSKRHAA